MSNDIYDVIVLGSGPAGGIIARQCNTAGLKVAVVEQNGWGGVCPLRGCEPKKTLADTAHTVSAIRDLAAKGTTGTTDVNWKGLMELKRSLIDPIPEAVLHSFTNHGTTALHGRARLMGDGKVEIEGHGTITAKDIVIAVGARPRIPDIPGKELLLVSDDFFEFETLPESMLILGGGFISLEFAGIAAAAGVETTVIHRSERVLRGFDGQLAEKLVDALREQGVQVLVNHPVTSAERTATGVAVLTESDGETKRFEAEAAILGIGRIPNTDDLGLEEAGVDMEKGLILVDEAMRSRSASHVWAAGDCVKQGMPLTPTAVIQAQTLVRNLTKGSEATADLRGAAAVAFTHPPLAAVGLLEEDAREKDIDIEVCEGDAAGWSEHERLGLTHAGYKVILEKGTDRIVGAHYLGQHAEEVANIFGLAIRHGITRQELLDHPWAYPSFGYALRYMLS